MNDLLPQLQALEVELHHPGVRCSRARLEQLLHPAFDEVDRSGRRYDRETVIRFLAEQPAPPPVDAGAFVLVLLAPGVALLNYRSADLAADGTRERHTLRASLWLHTAEGWQMRYHQGTPAAQPW